METSKPLSELPSEPEERYVDYCDLSDDDEDTTHEQSRIENMHSLGPK
jgi:hypothetical protein